MRKRARSEGTSFHHSLLQLSNGCVKKFIEPEYPFLPSEQEALIEDILEYRRRLHVAGIPIASEYSLSIKNGVIVEETVNCGVDGYKMLQRNVSHGERVLGQILRALRPIFLESIITLVPDPHPANWCFDEEGEVRYVDFQPARFGRENGVMLVGFPQPTGREYEWSVSRYYSKTGLARILLFNAMRGGGFPMRDLLLNLMRKEFGHPLFAEVKGELEALLEEQVRRGELSVREALESCDEWKIDDVRELAMVVAECMENGAATFLDKVLELSRADFNLSLAVRHQNVEQCKALILEKLSDVSLI